MVICLLSICGMGCQYILQVCCCAVMHTWNGIEADILDMLLAMLLLAWSFILYQFTVCNTGVGSYDGGVTCVLSDGRYRPCSHACHV